MKSNASFPLATAARLVAAALALSAATGTAFAAWMDNGAAIFLTMVENGLSWCF